MLGTETANRGSSPALFESFKALLATGARALKTRLELVSNELEEERERLEQIVLLAVGAFFCIALGLLLFTLFVIVLFWDTPYRLAVLGGFAVLYLAIGFLSAWTTLKKIKNKPPLFASTLEELRKDHEFWKS